MSHPLRLFCLFQLNYYLFVLLFGCGGRNCFISGQIVICNFLNVVLMAPKKKYFIYSTPIGVVFTYFILLGKNKIVYRKSASQVVLLFEVFVTDSYTIYMAIPFPVLMPHIYLSSLQFKLMKNYNQSKGPVKSIFSFRVILFYQHLIQDIKEKEH